MGEGKFRKFMLKLSRDLQEKDIKELVYLYEEDVPQAKLETVKDGLDLIRILQQMGIICEENFDDFIDSLKLIQRNDLAQRCEVYIKRNNSGESFTHMHTCTHMQAHTPHTHRLVVFTLPLLHIYPSSLCTYLQVYLLAIYSTSDLSFHLCTDPFTCLITVLNYLQDYLSPQGNYPPIYLPTLLPTYLHNLPAYSPTHLSFSRLNICFSYFLAD